MRKHTIRRAYLEFSGFFRAPCSTKVVNSVEELQLSFVDVLKLRNKHLKRLERLSAMPALKKVVCCFEGLKIVGLSSAEQTQCFQYLFEHFEAASDVLEALREITRLAFANCGHVEHFSVYIGPDWDFYEHLDKISFFADKQTSVIEWPFSPEDAARLPTFRGRLPPRALKWNSDGIPHFMSVASQWWG